ncbi:uncharacterized protein LOC133203693 [Saccostrea echinata]|uniref:uncharacterized protein LOC133203693 n=1 Tax=Saccostrea echinata TaxID=191078 RepID=UPI002A7FA2B0|nr:uncharacterized protein LOC133203693 [Saccostrea echinata]
MCNRSNSLLKTACFVQLPQQPMSRWWIMCVRIFRKDSLLGPAPTSAYVAMVNFVSLRIPFHSLKEKMATPTSWAQEVITCDLCPKPTQQFCNNCQVRLCVDCVKSLQSEFKNLISDMIQTVEQNKEILKNTKVTEVNNYKSKLSEYKDIPADIDVNIPSLNTNTVPGIEHELSLLSTRELLDIARVIATILTKCNKILSVACVDANVNWVSGDGKAIRIDIRGILRDTLGGSCLLGDIAVNSEGDLIYSHCDSRSINIVKQRKKKKTTITPKGWHPVGISCTKSGQILVSMVSTDRLQYKILRYRGKKMMQEIYKDEDGNPIYKGGKSSLFLAENNNEDICASDVNAQSVVVVDKTGRVRFRYNGKEDQHARLFYPIQKVTDSDCRIIVSDINNACLHILDKNEQFLMIVDNCGL